MGKRESKRNKASKRKSTSKDGVWTNDLHLSQEGRDGIEEDSGLGDSVPFADEEAGSSDRSSCHSSPRLLYRHGASLQFATISTHEKVLSHHEQKRLRLDLPEEANELPEEKYSTGAGGQLLPPLLSFKNVPALLSPLKNIPEEQDSLQLRTCSSPFAGLQQQMSIQRIVPAKVSMAVKEEKCAKKLASRHFLDRIYPPASVNCAAKLELIAQPEEQHRARYQTEGSRGAVKDRSGQGHPIIKLNGYNKPAVLLTYVAWDGGSVAPHMFYQAYKVSGKNSTPCKEEKLHGTTLLQMDLLPETDMTVSCDCVGLLKERNVDVEQKLKSPMHRGRRKSTKCRLVFRTTIKLDSGDEETLQIVSEPICCTQPPGVPEICRKSMASCLHEGGQELFIIGKNFFKDTKVIFQDKESTEESNPWKVTVTPDKDFLHQTHLICTIPPYVDGLLKEVEIEIVATSCGKCSEPHPFSFTPPSCRDKRTNLALADDKKIVVPLPAMEGTKEKVVAVAEPNVMLTQRKSPGISREQAIVHPIQMQQQMASMPMHLSQAQRLDGTRPCRANEVENTTPTTPAFSPLPTSLNRQNHNVHDEANSRTQVHIAATEPANKKYSESNQAVIENLLEMLKLARNTTIPTAQPAFVQMIADEILAQMKRGDNTASPMKREPEPVPVEASRLNGLVVRVSANGDYAEEKYPANSFCQSQQTIVNASQYDSIVAAKPNCLPTDEYHRRVTSAETVLVPRYTETKMAEVKTPNYLLSTLNGSMPLLSAEVYSSKSGTENSQSHMVLNTEYVQSSASPMPAKKINLRPVTVSRQTLLTNPQHSFLSKEEHSQNGYDPTNSVYLQGQSSKLELSNASRLQASEINLCPIVPVSPVQSQLYPSTAINGSQTVQTSCLEAPGDPSKLTMHNPAMTFNNTQDMHRNTLTLPTVHPINGNTLSGSTRSILHSATMTSSNRSLADPLLSQSTASGELYASSQQVLQLEPSDVNAQISQTQINSTTISPEVTKRFEQLSESELINYINPTCFDNV